MTPLAGGTTGGVHQVSVLLAISVSLGTLTVLLVKASAFSFTTDLFLGMTIYFMVYCPRTILRRRRGCFSLAETPPSRSSCFQEFGRPLCCWPGIYTGPVKGAKWHSHFAPLTCPAVTERLRRPVYSGLSRIP